MCTGIKSIHVQVQGQMYLSCRKFCFFVVWTTKDVAVMKIERDDSWSANIPQLIKFYCDYIFPKIVEGEL